METMKETEGLSSFKEELARFERNAAEIFEKQKHDQGIAYFLDEDVRSAAKVLSELVNTHEERSDEFAGLYPKLILNCGELFSLRNLAQKSFLMFRALTEAIEFLAHYQAMLYVFGNAPAPSLGAVLGIVLQEKKDYVDTIDHPKLTASIAQALVEAVGEISKGMEDIYTANRPRTPSEYAEMLGMFKRAEEVARLYLSTGKRLAPKYHKQISKYYRMMVARKAGSLRYLSSQIDRLEDRIDRMKDKK